MTHALRLLKGHHALTNAELATIAPADVTALMHVAQDPRRPKWQRLKALSLLGRHPSPEVFAIWQVARTWPKELRVQAAFSEGWAHRRDKSFSAYANALLGDDDPALREVAIHLLYAQGSVAATKQLEDRLHQESNPICRALIARRLRALHKKSLAP